MSAPTIKLRSLSSSLTYQYLCEALTKHDEIVCDHQAHLLNTANAFVNELTEDLGLVGEVWQYDSSEKQPYITIGSYNNGIFEADNLENAIFEWNGYLVSMIFGVSLTLLRGEVTPPKHVITELKLESNGNDTILYIDPLNNDSGHTTDSIEREITAAFNSAIEAYKKQILSGFLK